MQKHRSTLLGIGMLVCSALLLLAVANLVSALQPKRGDAPARPDSAPTAPAGTATPKPEPIVSVHVPILMYHHIEEISEDTDPEILQLYVAPQAFREQLDYLQQNGYTIITFAELVGAFNGEVSLPDKPVIVTFDDGWDDIYNVAYPMLRDHGMRATFFIPTNWVENLDGVVSWSQLQEMSASGMELGSHTVTHPYLTTADPEWMKYEIEGSKQALEEHTGKKVTALAYPFGLYDDAVIAAVNEAGYLAACTIDAGSTATATGLLTLPRTWVYHWTTIEDFAALLSAPN